jgi:RNA polymerase sigma-70 factor (ECF subfamily)
MNRLAPRILKIGEKRPTKAAGVHLVRVSARTEQFEQIALPHARSLLRVARRLTSDGSIAEDLVQDTLLSAWRSFDQLREDGNARAWLFRILFNAWYARGRKVRSVPVVMPLHDEVSVMTPRFDEAMEVSRALNSLEIDHRAVLMLGVVEGFTCRETAEILSIPVGTVMSRLSRARQAMRTRLNAGTPPEKCAEKEAS